MKRFLDEYVVNEHYNVDVHGVHDIVSDVDDIVVDFDLGSRSDPEACHLDLLGLNS